MCMCLFGQAECVRASFESETKALCGARGQAVKCVTRRHFLITNWSEINDILLS